MGRLPRWMSQLGETADAVFIADSRQHIRLWNKGAEKLLGHAASEALDRCCHELLAGTTRAGKAWCHADCRVQKGLRAGGAVPGFPVRFRARSGRSICGECSIIVLSRRRERFALHLMRDTSRQEREREAMQRILAIVQDVELPEAGAEPARAEAAPASAAGAAASRLTRREVEVLSLLAAGVSTPAIARTMGISVHTVRNHIRNVLDELGVHSKSQAVSFAYRNGLLH